MNRQLVNFRPGPVFDGSRMSDWERRTIWRWLQANGARRHTPADGKIVIHGGHVHFEEWPIRVDQPYMGKDLRRLDAAIRVTGEIPSRARTLKIRVPLDRWLDSREPVE